MEYEDFKVLNIKLGASIFISTGAIFGQLGNMDLCIKLIILGILWFVIINILLFLQIKGKL